MNAPCPICGYRVPDGPPREVALAESQHMRSQHPEEIERRMVAAGFRRGPNDEWVDTLAAND